MKLTVLGKYGPFPAPGGACSGYLVEADDVKLVLDMGSGTLSRLFQRGGSAGINAVLLSHLHSDHYADLLILRYAVEQLHKRGKDVPMPLTVVAPDQPDIIFRQLIASGVYDMLAASDGMRFRFGSITVTLHRMMHPIPSYAMDITDGRVRLFYTGDTGWNDRLVELCQGADLLLADTCYLSSDKTTIAAPHMTAKEVGELAREANVGRLICTHVWGGGYPDELILKEASEAYPHAEVAGELLTYFL